MIGQILAKMNRVAVNDLGILLPPGAGSGKYGPIDTGRQAALRFSTPFYYRQVGQPFHVTMIVDKSQFVEQDILSFEYSVPESITITPAATDIIIGTLPDDGRLQWRVIGSAAQAKGKITVTSGPFSAACEMVIAEQAAGENAGQSLIVEKLFATIHELTDHGRAHVAEASGVAEVAEAMRAALDELSLSVTQTHHTIARLNQMAGRFQVSQSSAA